MADRTALPLETSSPAIVSSMSTIAEGTKALAPDSGELVSQHHHHYQPRTEPLNSYKLLSKSQMDFLVGPMGYTSVTALLFSGQSVFGLKPFGPLPTEQDLAPYKDKLGPAIHPAILAHFGDGISLELATAILIWGISKLERRMLPLLDANTNLAQQNYILAREKAALFVELGRSNLVRRHQDKLVALKEQQIQTATRDRNILERSFNSFAENQIKNAVAAEQLTHQLQVSTLQKDHQAATEELQKQVLELKAQNDTLAREKDSRDAQLAEALAKIDDMKKQIKARDSTLATLKEEVETHEKQKKSKPIAGVSASTQTGSEDVPAPASSNTTAQHPLPHVAHIEKWLYCLFFLFMLVVWIKSGIQLHTRFAAGTPCVPSNSTGLPITGCDGPNSPQSSVAEGCP